jgi:hypothetical protein
MIIQTIEKLDHGNIRLKKDFYMTIYENDDPLQIDTFYLYQNEITCTILDRETEFNTIEELIHVFPLNLLDDYN